MLSHIGRAAIKRVGLRVPGPSSRALRGIWHLQRVKASNNLANGAVSTQFSLQLRRSYAAATTATRTTTSGTKKTTRATRGAAKKAVKKPAKRKAVKKAKPKAKRPVKKTLTPEQKEKAKVKDLKAIALLSPPKGKPSTAWQVLIGELLQEKGSGSLRSGRQSLSELSKEAAAKYKSLSPAELEQYNHRANENKAANAVALKQWVESHTPDQIREANNARNLLRKKAGASARGKYSTIADERIPKGRRSALTFFVQERWASGDLKGLKAQDGVAVIIKEWRALSPSERKPYDDRANADKGRYYQEYKTVFHRDPKSASP